MAGNSSQLLGLGRDVEDALCNPRRERIARVQERLPKEQRHAFCDQLQAVAALAADRQLSEVEPEFERTLRSWEVSIRGRALGDPRSLFGEITSS